MNHVNEKIVDREKVKAIALVTERSNFEISQALVMITLYVKLNVHSSYPVCETSYSAKSGGQTDRHA